MNISRLTPADSASHSATAQAVVPGVAGAMAVGAVSFGLVSVIAYSIWAFRLLPGTAALYSTTAAAYIGLGGLALSRLVQAPAAWKRFPFVFAAGFLAYAICWCAFWFGLNGKHHADLWGAAVGLAAMAWFLRRAFHSTTAFLPVFAVLFTFHSLGYYLGDILYAAVSGTIGRLSWGAAHGLGFGAGLGYLLSQCQTPPSATRIALNERQT